MESQGSIKEDHLYVGPILSEVSDVENIARQVESMKCRIRAILISLIFRKEGKLT